MEGDIGFCIVTVNTRSSIFYMIFINFRVGLAIKGEGGLGASILIHYMLVVLMCAALH